MLAYPARFVHVVNGMIALSMSANCARQVLQAKMYMEIPELYNETSVLSLLKLLWPPAGICVQKKCIMP